MIRSMRRIGVCLQRPLLLAGRHLPSRFWRVAPPPGLEAELAGLGCSDWWKKREGDREREQCLLVTHLAHNSRCNALAAL